MTKRQSSEALPERDGKVEVSTPVLVLDPGDVGFGIARSLGRLGVPVHGIQPRSGLPGAKSRYWTSMHIWDFVHASVNDSVGFVSSLANKLGSRPIIIPADDNTALFVADNAGQLRNHFLFPDQPDGLARQLSSKAGMHALCEQHELPTPKTFFPTSVDELLAFANQARYPLMIKGIFTLATEHRNRMRLVTTPLELRRQYERMEAEHAANAMVQEYIPGGQENLWVFEAYFDHESRCLFSGTGQKLRQYPPYIGRTSLGVYRSNPELTSLASKFMSAIGYRGILDSGFKFDERTGQYMLLDANPRIGTPFRLFTDRSGTDVARALYLDLTGQGVLKGDEPEGRRWVVEDNDLSSSFTHLRDRRLTIPKWFMSYRGVEEACWTARDDLRPAVARAGRLLLGLSDNLVRLVSAPPKRQ